MRINSIKKNNCGPSFGLKIQKDEGYRDFIERACGKKWNCSTEDVENFIEKLEDMHFSQEKKDDTCIIFGQAEKQVEGYRQVPSVTYRNKFVNEPIYATIMPCSFYKTNCPDKETMHTVIKLNGATLDDVLSEIASSYAQYIYSRN